MIVGHFAVGLILKRADKSLSLGLLFIATQLSDLVFGFTSLAGIEKINIVTGTNAATSIQYTFYPYSHSLLATLIWAALTALIFLIVPVKSSISKSKTALVMATAVLSHFLLDFIVHNPDLDILGNGAFKIGLGLWNYLCLLRCRIITSARWIMGLPQIHEKLNSKRKIRHVSSHHYSTDTGRRRHIHVGTLKRADWHNPANDNLLGHNSSCILVGPKKNIRQCTSRALELTSRI